MFNGIWIFIYSHWLPYKQNCTRGQFIQHMYEFSNGNHGYFISNSILLKSLSTSNNFWIHG